MRTLIGSCVFVLAGLFFLHPLRAEEPKPEVPKAFVTRVFRRILAETKPSAEFLKGNTWPPALEVFSAEDGMKAGAGAINAFATVRANEGKPVLDPTGRRQTLVVVTEPFLREFVEGHEERLGFVLGHELGHLLLGHVGSQQGGGLIDQLATGRKRELDADTFGAKTALAAGYSRRAYVGLWKAARDRSIQPYCSIQHLADVHPSWTDRMERVDGRNSNVWKSMAAFENGVFLAQTGQFEAAAESFARVVHEFPKVGEAHANLGCARLLQYLDELRADDVRKLGFGCVVPLPVYLRAKSLEAELKGADVKLWRSAVADLERAVALDDKLALAHANLGVAALISPLGKDLKEGWKHFERAGSLMHEAQGVTNLQWGCIFVSASVAQSLLGNTKAAAYLRQKAQEKRAIRFAKLKVRLEKEGRPQLWSRAKDELEAEWAVVDEALAWNKAFTTQDDPRAAFERWQDYLRRFPGRSIWHDLALDYAKPLAEKVGGKLPPGKAGSGALRDVLSVELKGGSRILLGQNVSELPASLGKGIREPLSEEGSLDRLVYPDHDLELLVDGQVLAVRLVGPHAPKIQLPGTGLGAPSITLGVGMKTVDLARLLKGKPRGTLELVGGRRMLYVPEIGLAFDGNKDAVTEIALVRIHK